MIKKLIFYIFFISLMSLDILQASQESQERKLEQAVSSFNIEKIRPILIENSSMNINPISYNASLSHVINTLSNLYSSPTYIDPIFCTTHKTYQQTSIENTLKIFALLLQYKADPTLAHFQLKELSPLAQLLASYLFLKQEKSSCKTYAMQRTLADVVRLSSQHGIDLNNKSHIDLKPLGIRENLSFNTLISWLISPTPQINK